MNAEALALRLMNECNVIEARCHRTIRSAVKNEAVPAAGLDLITSSSAHRVEHRPEDVLFYPARHQQVKKSIDLAYGVSASP